MRILFAINSLPEPPDYGGAQRTHNFLRALSMYGDVDLVIVREWDLSDVEEAALPTLNNVVAELTLTRWDERPPKLVRSMARLSPRLAANVHHEIMHSAWIFKDRAVHGWLDQLRPARNYDVFVGRQIHLATRLGAFGRMPVMVDFDDPPNLVLESQLTSDRKVRLSAYERLRTRFQAAMARRFLRKCAHVWFLSQNDRAHFFTIRGNIAPNIPFGGVRDLGSPPAHSSLVLFVGMVTFPPNQTGLARFLEHIWPRVRARVPAAVFRIVGKIDASLQSAWARDGVEITGRVPTLETHYREASICVAPIYWGGGTNIKVLEAAACGRASVVTPFAHYGFESELQDGECVLVAPSDDTFVEHLVSLLGDPARAAAMGAAGMAAIERDFSFKQFAAAVGEGLRVLERGA